MKTNSLFSVPTLRFLLLAAGAVLVLLATTPAQAQVTVNVPPVTIDVPALTVQVPKLAVTVPVPDTAALLETLAGPLDLIPQTLAMTGEMLADQMRAYVTTQDRGKRPLVVSVPRSTGFSGSLYEAGLSMLDRREWARAVDAFDRVIKAGKTRVDGALYWKAYALDRLGRRNEALATLQELLKSHPDSRWLSDARALEIEVRQNAGQPVKPEDHADEDLKLLAINSVMHTDPERAVPMLQQVINGRNSLKVKERALFVLAQSRSPQARQAVAQVARGAGNPDLQMRAVRYLGFAGGSNKDLLADIYASSKDTDVKREIISSLTMSGDVDRLLNIAKTETSPELRIEAIRGLGMMRAETQLLQLYQVPTTDDLRQEILRSIAGTGNATKLAEIAATEADAKHRAEAVRSLGAMDNEKAGATLVQIYKADKDEGVKKAVVAALARQQNAKALVELARAESNPALKKEIVSRLSMMKSKEATDYMMELLK